VPEGQSLVRLGDVIHHRAEFVEIRDLDAYKRCRVQLHAQGVVLRDTIVGAEVKTKKQQVCRAGEFLVAEIDAKVGGFGLVPPGLDGAIVSSHYFLFVIDDDKLDRRYLDWFIRTPFFQDQVRAHGSTNYAAIRPRDVLSYWVPLPSLVEQRRIVTWLVAVTSKTQAASQARQSACQAARALLASVLVRNRLELLGGGCEVRRVGDVARVLSGGTPSRNVAAYWGGDIPWIKTAELVDGDISDADEHITDEGLTSSSAKLFPPDTILVALYGQGQTRGRTGRLVIEAATNQACCAILPSPDLEPRFTQYWLRSLYTEMRAQSRDGAQPNWNAQMIKDIRIAVPPVPVQQRTVHYLQQVQQVVDAVAARQRRVQEELWALSRANIHAVFLGISTS